MTLFHTQFVLSADAMASLASLILGVVILGSLLSVREKSRATWWLLGYLLGFAVLMGVLFILTVLALPSWLPLQALSAAWGAGCLIQFAYCFPRPTRAAEARRALILSAGAWLITLILFPLWFYSLTDIVLVRLLALGLSAVQFGWGIIVLARRTVELSPATRARISQSSRVWTALTCPAGREAQAARAFVLAALSPLLIAVWAVLYYGGLVPVGLFTLVFNLGVLVFPFVFVMVYLNYALEPTTFMLKLTLSTLVVVLAALNLVSQTTLTYFEASYKQARRADVEQAKHTLTGGSADLPAAIAFIISRHLNAGRQYTLHFARDPRFDLDYVNGQGLGWIPTLPISQAGPESDSFYYHASFEQAGREYVVGFPLATYAAALNPHALPIVYVMLGSVGLVVLIMPLFFRVSLVRPLNALLEGVRQVNAGNKTVVVPIQHTDEIGFLTEAFNRMVVSVRQAEELKVLRQEMDLARAIQMSLLPQAAPNIPGLDIAATSLPAREVGGDLYTFYALSNGDYGVAIGDVTGKGIPAALYMAVSTTMLEAKGPFISDVAQLLSEMNVALFPHMQPNHMNTALCCVRLEPVNGGYIAHIANAGMVAPILRRGTECKYLEVGGIPVGMLRAGLPYRTLTLPVQPGDLLVLSSDGIVEAMNVQNELYSFERLVGRVSTAPRSAALEIQDWILADVRAFAGDAEQHDDVTLIVMMAQNDQ